MPLLKLYNVFKDVKKTNMLQLCKRKKWVTLVTESHIF